MAHGDGDDSVGSEMDRRAEWRRHADAAVAVERPLDEDRSEQNGNGGRGQDVIEADPRPPAEPSGPGPRLGRVVSVEEGDGGAGPVATNTETLVGADARHTCRISAPSVPLTVGRAGGSGGLFDPESLHQRLERRPLHAETRGRTPGASQHPVRLLEGTPDVGAVDTAARRVMVANRRGSPTPRKVVERHLEPPAARKDHRALDQVRELADVPGPRVPTERVQRLARDDLDPAVHGTREPLDEVAHQGGNVLGPLAERRGLDREHVQPVVEIVPEPLLFHHPKEVAVRRGDEADVDLDRLRTADPLELLLLQDAQQLRLELERDLADLVEEQRAAVGHLEAADLLGDGAGEGAPLVPEELALE